MIQSRRHVAEIPEFYLHDLFLLSAILPLSTECCIALDVAKQAGAVRSCMTEVQESVRKLNPIGKISQTMINMSTRLTAIKIYVGFGLSLKLIKLENRCNEI